MLQGLLMLLCSCTAEHHLIHWPLLLYWLHTYLFIILLASRSVGDLVTIFIYE